MQVDSYRARQHFKLAEHAEYLKKTHVGLAVGTPNRIEKLLNETGAFLRLSYRSLLTPC